MCASQDQEPRPKRPRSTLSNEPRDEGTPDRLAEDVPKKDDGGPRDVTTEVGLIVCVPVHV